MMPGDLFQMETPGGGGFSSYAHHIGSLECFSIPKAAIGRPEVGDANDAADHVRC